MGNSPTKDSLLQLSTKHLITTWFAVDNKVEKIRSLQEIVQAFTMLCSSICNSKPSAKKINGSLFDVLQQASTATIVPFSNYTFDFVKHINADATTLYDIVNDNKIKIFSFQDYISLAKCFINYYTTNTKNRVITFDKKVYNTLSSSLQIDNDNDDSKSYNNNNGNDDDNNSCCNTITINVETNKYDSSHIWAYIVDGRVFFKDGVTSIKEPICFLKRQLLPIHFIYTKATTTTTTTETLSNMQILFGTLEIPINAVSKTFNTAHRLSFKVQTLLQPKATTATTTTTTTTTSTNFLSVTFLADIHCTDIAFFKEKVLSNDAILTRGITFYRFNAKEPYENEKISFTDNEIKQIVSNTIYTHFNFCAIAQVLQRATLQKFVIEYSIQLQSTRIMHYDVNLNYFCGSNKSEKFYDFSRYYNGPHVRVEERTRNITLHYINSPKFKIFFIEWINAHLEKFMQVMHNNFDKVDAHLVVFTILLQKNLIKLSNKMAVNLVEKMIAAAINIGSSSLTACETITVKIIKILLNRELIDVKNVQQSLEKCNARAKIKPKKFSSLFLHNEVELNFDAYDTAPHYKTLVVKLSNDHILNLVKCRYIKVSIQTAAANTAKAFVFADEPYKTARKSVAKYIANQSPLPAELSVTSVQVPLALQLNIFKKLFVNLTLAINTAYPDFPPEMIMQILQTIPGFVRYYVPCMNFFYSDARVLVNYHN